MNEIGVKYNFIINTNDFKQSMKQCQTSAQSLESTLGGIVKTLKQMAVVKVLFDTGKKIAQLGDEFDKMSEKLGMSAKQYQQWNYICQRSGVSASTLQTAVKKLAMEQAKASAGASDSAEGFQKLGISLNKINSLSSGDMYEEVVEKLQAIPDATQRTAIATKIFGKNVGELNTILNMTADETDILKGNLNVLGGVMSDSLVKVCAEVDDAVTDLKTAVNGLLYVLGEAFLPTIRDLIYWLTVGVVILKDFFSIIFGIDTTISDTDWSSPVDDYGDSIDDGTKKTKKLLQLISGFDELNILNSNDESGTIGGLKGLEDYRRILDGFKMPDWYEGVKAWMEENKELLKWSLLAGIVLGLLDKLLGLFNRKNKSLGTQTKLTNGDASALGDLVSVVGLAVATLPVLNKLMEKFPQITTIPSQEALGDLETATATAMETVEATATEACEAVEGQVLTTAENVISITEATSDIVQQTQFNVDTSGIEESFNGAFGRIYQNFVQLLTQIQEGMATLNPAPTYTPAKGVIKPGVKVAGPQPITDVGTGKLTIPQNHVPNSAEIMNSTLDAIKNVLPSKNSYANMKQGKEDLLNKILGPESLPGKTASALDNIFSGVEGSAVGLGAMFAEIMKYLPFLVPGLAVGGVINQPTIAMVGEYTGASSNPEIITPENKMREVFAESNGMLGEIFVAVGRQIVSAIQEQDNSIVIGDDVIARSASRGNKAYQMRTGTSLI